MIGSRLHLPKQDLIRYAASQGRPSPRLDHVVLHLQAGCESCAAWIERYRKAIEEARPQGPAEGVPASWIRPRRVESADGVRAGLLADTSLVCGAGPYELDVLVRQFESPRSLEIAGQITRADQVHEPVSDLAVALVEPNATHVVMATSTDPFGEFDLAADLENPYGLRCGEDEDAPCVLVWEGGL